ncbi:MAG: hypothetical protein N2376_07785, partial [Clostridia bacterium]|nr:hypothetical protein [Clostridia bacterium]
MKTKAKDDIQIVSRKIKSDNEPLAKPKVTAEAQKQVELKRHSSIASRISASYTNMFATWLSVSLAVIFVLVLVFKIFYMIYDTKPYMDKIKTATTTQSFVDTIESMQGGSFILVNDKDQIIASNFSEVQKVTPPRFFSIQIIKNKAYLIYTKTFEVTDGQQLRLLIYNDITIILTEVVVTGAIALLLFLVSMLVIYVRGNYLTRKAFGVLDELVVKANNISSQNLNLRLNVSDSTDELVEFALTFNRMMDRIEKAYEKQNQFVSDASHELRTPIAVIQGYSRMLERWGKEDKEILQESISAINKESKGMQDLVDKLLFIARNDKDTLVLVKEKFDMSELIQEMARDTRLLETQHEIRTFVEPNVMIYGDRSRIKQ